MNSLVVLSSLRTSGAWNEDDVKTNNPYPTSAKEYFLNFLNERARPPEDISSSTYLTSVIDDIFGTQSIIDTIEVSPGEIVKSINIASILDNVYEFGRDEMFFSEDNWARANLTVESVCASAMRIYKDPSDGLYRIWCSCCKGHISSSGSLEFNSLHDAIEEIPYASIFHRIIRVIGSSEGNSVNVEEFNRPYWLLPHHLSSNTKPEVIPCMPSTVEHDNCLGNDQLLVSAMMNEINCDVSLHSTCWINVVECIFIGKDLSSSHDYLQSRYEQVLGGTTTSEVFTKPSKNMMYLEDVDEWESKHLLLDDILLQKANKIMLVDWLHESFPTYIPDDFLILENHDLKHLGFMLKNNPFNIKFFHQLGLLQCYLDSAPEGSEDAHIYRRLPMVSRPFAYECSNLCSDIFSTAGRNNTIKSSKLFVVESEVMESVYLDMVKLDMKGVNLVPSKNKNKKTIQWILDDDVVDILPKPFINSLMHGVWQPLSKEAKNKLAKYSNNRSHSYRKADELTVVSLHPYQAYYQGSTNKKNHIHQSLAWLRPKTSFLMLLTLSLINNRRCRRIERLRSRGTSR